MRIAVLGSGFMGNGIALTSAINGLSVTNIDVSESAIKQAKQFTEQFLNKKLEKQLITQQQKDTVLSRISYSSDYDAVKNTDLIIEAVPEIMSLKKDLFILIDHIAPAHAILATNTSALSISEIASVTSRPAQVIGVHFFSPVPVMKLVEIIRGLETSDETYQTIQEFIVKINKTAINCPEYPGFIVNRLLIPLINEAAFLVMAGSKPKDIDTAMKLGVNHPMGPLELADFIGIDIVLAIMNGLYDGFKDSKYRPCPILANMVRAGHLGRKKGKGFYCY